MAEFSVDIDSHLSLHVNALRLRGLRSELLARLFEHLRRPRKDFSSDITPVDLARGGARGDELMERCGLEPDEAALVLRLHGNDAQRKELL